MADFPKPPDAATLQRLFDTPIPERPQTFNLALVLGGTVSAGAYTAGVLDFLFEALDTWTANRDAQNPAAPPHHTILNVITGTSGGGVNAAIAARVLAYDYAPVTRVTATLDKPTGNPLFDVWVNELTLSEFLGTQDLKRNKPISLLDGTAIDRAARTIETFELLDADKRPQFKKRSYLADPLRVILTLTNLRGVPYLTSFSPAGAPASGETFVNHGDHARFAVVYPGTAPGKLREDELAVGFADARLPQAIDWPTFSRFARATSAFPIGFPPRELVRPMDHLRYRIAVIPSDGVAPIKLVPLVPNWSDLVDDSGTLPLDYNFLTVDGGATNNEPIELGRTFLSGVSGRNPRDGDRATRAVLLVDPFAGKADCGPQHATTLLDAGGALVTGMIQQTRYHSRDLLMATDDTIFSRFMITATRGTKTGGDAIAAAGLGAFIGFACKPFMRHDYLLGRANCQAYLRNQLVLPNTNPLFNTWTPDQRKAFAVDLNGQRCLPIIPLMDAAAVPESTDPWPRGALDPERYRDAIEERFDALIEAEGSGGILSAIVAWLLAHVGQRAVADFVIGKMNAALKDAGLAK